MADNRSSRKINDLCQEYGLSQLISDFTHFTETSQSTIDLLLTNNSNDVLISGIRGPFLDQNIRYHCVLNFNKQTKKKKTNIFKRHIWLFDQGDYLALSNELRNTNWERLKDADLKNTLII